MVERKIVLQARQPTVFVGNKSFMDQIKSGV